MTKTMRFILPAVLATGFLAFAGSGCELIASVDRTKISGSGGTGATGGGGDGGMGGNPMCDAAACDAMDEECLDFSCNADNTACDEGVAVAANENCLITTANICTAEGQCVEPCDVAACDAMDTECLDFSCNAQNTGCDAGVAVAPGMNCLMTMANICNDNGVCVPVGCTNMFQDGEETDIDCGGSMCDGCDNGLMCMANSDCRSNNCDTNTNTCVPCTDGNNDCGGATYCDDENADMAEHVCKPTLANGTACDAPTYGDEQCANSNCVDGVCCDGGCSGLCEACDVTGLEGACSPLPMGQGMAECPMDNSQCQAGGCSGTGNTCAASSAATECRMATGVCDVAENCNGSSTGCPADAVVTAISMTVCNAAPLACDIAETCDGTNKTCPTDVFQNDGFDTMGNCNGYLCDGNMAACPTTCAGDNDCESTHFCNGSNNCVLKGALGASCGGNNECANNQCVDGICCASSTCATCQECGGAMNDCVTVTQGQQDDDSCSGATQACDGNSGAGSCKDTLGESCTMGSTCASGICADNVCCDVACSGTCEACNNSGSVGTCSAHAPGTNPETPPDCTMSGQACDGAGVGMSSCKLIFGETCTMNSECISNNCMGTCQL